MVYGASKRISTSFGSVATIEDGILYSSAIDFWSFSSFDDDEEEALAERKHLFGLVVVVLLFRLLGDEVVASEDESMRSDVAVDMMWSLAWEKIFNIFIQTSTRNVHRIPHAIQRQLSSVAHVYHRLSTISRCN